MKCDWCNKDMSNKDTISCAENVKVDFGDGVRNPIRFGDEKYHWDGESCHDCNIKIGGIHHPGCDVEECPKCHGQLISCGCLEYEEDQDD